MNARVFLARLHLRLLGLAHAASTPALLTIASARKPRLTAAQLLDLPAGHRVTLIRRHLIGRATVITTNANPDHASALADLRHQFRAVTGRAYLPRRGDTITHEVTK